MDVEEEIESILYMAREISGHPQCTGFCGHY